jgi:TPR repeat protein
MRKILRTLLIGLMLTVSGEIVRAGPLEDGIAAYRSGDYATALRILRPLAEQGNSTAQVFLGLMYSQGQGVVQDNLRAHMWLNLAASRLSGNEALGAAEGRKMIEKRMTTEQVVRAQEMARQCESRSFKNCD